MLEAKKRNDPNQKEVLHLVRKQAQDAGEAPRSCEPGENHRLEHALRAARANERSLRQRLHRVHDPRGMELLRGLREHISCLEERLRHGGQDDES